MEIKITQDIVDYIKAHKPQFELPVPELGEVWEVDRVNQWPVACNGEPVVEVSRGKSWMRLPVYGIGFSQDHIKKFLQNLNKKTAKESADTVVYKIRHKATGLYFTPGNRKNLTENGKVYYSRNNTFIVRMLTGGYPYCIRDSEGKNLIVTAEDFELVPFKLVPLNF